MCPVSDTHLDVYKRQVKYRDLNGDNVIDNNDQKAIGYSTAIPEIYSVSYTHLDVYKRQDMWSWYRFTMREELGKLTF